MMEFLKAATWGTTASLQMLMSRFVSDSGEIPPLFLPLYIRIKSASDKAWPIHPRDAANTASGK